jgi:hypothetical protein
MKNKKSVNKEILSQYILLTIVILFVALLISNISSSLMWRIGLTEDKTSVIAGMLSGVLAAVAAGLVLFQLRENEKEQIRQNDIAEATFIMQHNQSFIQDKNMCDVQHLLEEQVHYGRKEEIINDENRQHFVNYLVHLEGLAPLIIEGLLNLEHIDDLLSYRFYLAVNNKELQEKELKPFADYYRGCFKIYKIWTEYRKKKGYSILLEDSSLDKWDKFDIYSKR